MAHPFDEELVQKAKEGDKAAFKEIFDRCSGKVLSYLYRYMGNYQKAEDVMIETFLDVYKRLSSYKESGKFLSWVYKIATNFAKKEFRKSKVRELSLDEVRESSGKTIGSDLSSGNKTRPDYQAMGNELTALIEKCLAKLDEKYRSVILLCDVDGLSYEDAAFILKCDKGTVGVRLNRARILLRDMLQKFGYHF